MESSHPYMKKLLLEIENDFHLDKIKPVITIVKSIIDNARIIERPLMDRIGDYQRAIGYFQNLQKIFLKRPVSEKLGLSRYQKKIDQHLDSFNKEVSIIISSKKVNTPQLPFEQIDPKYKNILEQKIILPVMNPKFYRKDFNAMLISGPQGMGKTFLVRSMVKYLNVNKIEVVFLELGGKGLPENHDNNPQNDYLEKLFADFQYLEDTDSAQPVIVLLDDFDLYLSKSTTQSHHYHLEKLRHWSTHPNLFIVATSSTPPEQMPTECHRLFNHHIPVSHLTQRETVHFFDYSLHRHLTCHLWKQPVQYFRPELRIPLLDCRENLQRLALQLSSSCPDYEKLQNILSTSYNTASLAALHHNRFYPIRYNSETVYLSELSFKPSFLQKSLPGKAICLHQPPVQSITVKEKTYQHRNDYPKLPHLEDERISQLFVHDYNPDSSHVEVLAECLLQRTDKNSTQNIMYGVYDTLLQLFTSISGYATKDDLYQLTSVESERLETLFQNMIKGDFQAPSDSSIYSPTRQYIWIEGDTPFSLSYGKRSTDRITKYKDGITPTIDSNRMRQILMYLLSGKLSNVEGAYQMTPYLSVDISTELTVIESSTQRGYLWTVNFHPSYTENNDNQSRLEPFRPELFTSTSTHAKITSGFSVSSDVISIPADYEITNEHDISLLQEQFGHAYQDLYPEEYDTWKGQKIRDPKHLAFLESTYNSEDKFYISVLHCLNRFKSSYTGYLSSEMNSKLEGCYSFIQNTIDRLLQITEEYSDSDEWNEMWSLSNNHYRKSERKPFSLEDLSLTKHKRSKRTKGGATSSQHSSASIYDNDTSSDSSDSESEIEKRSAIYHDRDVWVSWRLFSLLFHSTNIYQYTSLSEILKYHQKYHYNQFDTVNDRFYLQAKIPIENFNLESDESDYYYSQYLGDMDQYPTTVDGLQRLQHKMDDGGSLYFDCWRYLESVGLQNMTTTNIDWYTPPSHPIWKHWGEIGHFHRHSHSLQSLLNLVDNCENQSWKRLMTSHLLSSKELDEDIRERLFMGVSLYPLRAIVDDLDYNIIDWIQTEVTLPIFRYRYQYLQQYLPEIRIPLRVEGMRGQIKDYNKQICERIQNRKTTMTVDNSKKQPEIPKSGLRSLHIRPEYLEEAAIKNL